MQIRELLDRLDLIESLVPLTEDADQVIGSLQLALKYNAPLTGTKIASGIDDEGLRLNKIANVLAAIEIALTKGKGGELLDKIEVKSQDVATKGLVGAASESASFDDIKNKWKSLVTAYETTKKAGQLAAELANLKSKLTAKPKNQSIKPSIQTKYA